MNTEPSAPVEASGDTEPKGTPDQQPQPVPDSRAAAPGKEPDPEGTAAGGQPMTRGRLLLVVVLLAVIAGAMYNIARNVYTNYIARKPVPTDIPMDLGECGMAPLPDPTGNPDAPIHLQVCMGHCIAPVMTGIHDAVAGWPDIVRAQFYAFESSEGQDLLAAHNETIACIFIDGKNEFEIPGPDGTKRTVVFRGPPGDGYTLKDFVEVLRRHIQSKTGKLPEDFDARAAELASGNAGACAARPCPASCPAPTK